MVAVNGKMIAFLEECLDVVLERYTRYAMVSENSSLDGSNNSLKNQVMTMHKGGMTKKDIAQKVGVSRSTVFKICKGCTRCSKEEKMQEFNEAKGQFKEVGNKILERRRSSSKRLSTVR